MNQRKVDSLFSYDSLSKKSKMSFNPVWNEYFRQISN